MSALKAVIAPSMLSSDFACLADEAKRMLSFGADWLHMDVMVCLCSRSLYLKLTSKSFQQKKDGHFVNNLTLGAPIVKALRSHTDAFLDCHLMASDPGRWVDDFSAAGASQFTFHLESLASADDVVALIERVRAARMRVGIALKPGTKVDEVMPFVDSVDMVLVMTVEPGFGGQAFMADMMPKVEALRSKRPLLDIQVDGGLGESTIEAAAKAGANVIVAGSAIFKSSDPERTIAALRSHVEEQLSS
jgi:ribulose-phosphate 3-epimerase